MGLDELIIQRREQTVALARKHGARNVRVFGSMARDEVGPDSDATFLILGTLLIDVQDLFRRKVDIVTEEALHRLIRNKILKEAVRLRANLLTTERYI